CEVHAEFRLPVIEFLGIDQHLAHAPRFAVLRRLYISMAAIARLVIETDALVVIIVGFDGICQRLGIQG
ncbi:MAG: hypothetical protein JWO89_2330, partial [Verrucomicrobiaceae bacterium]|nr:hypothetical protein [Verrucomicrobiaceae bacterium]